MLGIDFSSQRRKLQGRDWVSCVALMATHDTVGRQQDTLMIDSKAMIRWLIGIDQGSYHHHEGS